MKYSAAVIDTNVVVAGVLTANADAPTARILAGMLHGTFSFLISEALLAEYREVLLRRKIRTRHELSEDEVDVILTAIAANAIVREPEPRGGSPDAGDDHLWSLVQSQAGSLLVTGDLALVNGAPADISILLPVDFAKELYSE